MALRQGKKSIDGVEIAFFSAKTDLMHARILWCPPLMQTDQLRQLCSGFSTIESIEQEKNDVCATNTYRLILSGDKNKIPDLIQMRWGGKELTLLLQLMGHTPLGLKCLTCGHFRAKCTRRMDRARQDKVAGDSSPPASSSVTSSKKQKKKKRRRDRENWLLCRD